MCRRGNNLTKRRLRVPTPKYLRGFGLTYSQSVSLVKVCFLLSSMENLILVPRTQGNEEITYEDQIKRDKLNDGGCLIYSENYDRVIICTIVPSSYLFEIKN